MEDNFLYPTLKKHPKEEVRDMAHLLSIELGGIKDAFIEYTKRWISADTIELSTALFISETKALATALQHRIKKEENDLFPIL